MKYALVGFVMAASIVCMSNRGFAASDAPGIGGALSADPAVVQQAVASLREAGPAGLGALLAQYDKSPDPRLLPVIDAVAGQHDGVYSRLYWYTDTARASEVASAAHKPILYLRMLGKLTDEYSCANSRFFRTVLYANADVSKYLREHYVLVWVSERPVPVVTIDYGDGRVVKRTLTGNSIHYVLTAQGQVVDALPGLYDPKTFLAILGGAEQLAARQTLSPREAKQYFDTREQAIRLAWQTDASRAAPGILAPFAAMAGGGNVPDAAAAMKRTASKGRFEGPLLVKISPRQIAAAMDQSLTAADDAAWQKIAALHSADAALDASSLALMRSQNPGATRNSEFFGRMTAQFQQTIALDTVHNNYQLRGKILSWLREAPALVQVEDLNRRVYAELFMTPRSDPWLGLMPDATYSGLNGDGCAAGALRGNTVQLSQTAAEGN